MKTWKCRCGRHELTQDRPPFACSRCPKCGTALTLDGSDLAPKKHEIVPNGTVFSLEVGDHRLTLLDGTCVHCQRGVGKLLWAGVREDRLEYLPDPSLNLTAIEP